MQTAFWRNSLFDYSNWTNLTNLVTHNKIIQTKEKLTYLTDVIFYAVELSFIKSKSPSDHRNHVQLLLLHVIVCIQDLLEDGLVIEFTNCSVTSSHIHSLQFYVVISKFLVICSHQTGSVLVKQKQMSHFENIIGLFINWQKNWFDLKITLV